MKIKYEAWDPTRGTVELLEQCNDVIEDLHEGQGYTLTVRQLYYQLVRQTLIPNDMRSYDRVKRVLTRGRMAGFIDWEAIEDRTRRVIENPHWESEAALLRTAAKWHLNDMWRDQAQRVVVWIEKDALSGILTGVCEELDVQLFPNRGNLSASWMWRAAQQFVEWIEEGQSVLLLHLGDHDPSGVAMTDDIAGRLREFGVDRAAYEHLLDFEVRRIALTMDQVREYDPPPNPAKLSDSNAKSYVKKYGALSWELDALTPDVLNALVREHVEPLIDEVARDARREKVRAERKRVLDVSENWKRVVRFLK